MPLDQDQLQKIQQHIASKRVNPQCHACGGTEWQTGEIVASPCFAPGGISIGGPTVPMVQMICGRCGYVMHFAAKAVGLV